LDDTVHALGGDSYAVTADVATEQGIGAIVAPRGASRPACMDRPPTSAADGAVNYERACLGDRPLFSGTFVLWGAASIQVITAPSASHAAQMGSSPQPTAGPGLGKVVPTVGTTRPLASSQLFAATKAITISAPPAIQIPIHAYRSPRA
jgi:hypothetical protein